MCMDVTDVMNLYLTDSCLRLRFELHLRCPQTASSLTCGTLTHPPGRSEAAAWLAPREGAEHLKAPFCSRQAEVHGSIKKKTKRSDMMSGICFQLIQCGELGRDETRLGHAVV